MAEPKVVIKKYENRRLFDTGASRYLSLDDVARMVRDGINLQVVDAARRRGSDARDPHANHHGGCQGPRVRSAAGVIAQVDRSFGSRSTHDFLTWYLTTVTEMYQKAQSALQTRPLDLVRNLLLRRPFEPPRLPAPCRKRDRSPPPAGTGTGKPPGANHMHKKKPRKITPKITEKG